MEMLSDTKEISFPVVPDSDRAEDLAGVEKRKEAAGGQ